MARPVLRLLIPLLCGIFPGAALAEEIVTCRPNIFGGRTCRTRDGDITSRPNIFGGEDFTLPDGSRVRSVPNIFGGRDYQPDRGPTIRCRPNIFGGEDCQMPSGYARSRPNMWGGQDYRLPRGARNPFRAERPDRKDRRGGFPDSRRVPDR